MKKKLALIILDGFWLNNETLTENWIYQANNAVFNTLFTQHYAQLKASWEAVGLPAWQMGNSEVGHITLGSGRIIEQNFVTINKLLDSGEFAKKEEFIELLNHCKDNQSNLHLIQIFGNWGVHSVDQHISKLLPLIPTDQKTYIHFFWDGRDLPPHSAQEQMLAFESLLKEYPQIKIASFGGRYFGMDRDNNWERVQKAYDQIIAKKDNSPQKVSDYLASCYQQWIGDEFIPPISFEEGEAIKDHDGVFFINFRTDRARQFTQALMVSQDTENQQYFPTRDPNFKIQKLQNIKLLTMTKYFPEYQGLTILKEKNTPNTVSEIFANHNLRQLHLAETEKFAHVTKFFNAEKSISYPGQENILVPSHKVATYDLDPDMSAKEIFEIFKKNIEHFDVFIINYANGDMVGHTGSMPAVIQAVNTLGKIVQDTLHLSKEYNLDILLSADHGNCEEMGSPENPKTSHTTNLVPLRYIQKGVVQKNLKTHGELSDIAPSMLAILGISIPEEMSGVSLIEK